MTPEPKKLTEAELAEVDILYQQLKPLQMVQLVKQIPHDDVWALLKPIILIMNGSELTQICERLGVTPVEFKKNLGVASMYALYQLGQAHDKRLKQRDAIGAFELVPDLMNCAKFTGNCFGISPDKDAQLNGIMQGGHQTCRTAVMECCGRMRQAMLRSNEADKALALNQAVRIAIFAQNAFGVNGVQMLRHAALNSALRGMIQRTMDIFNFCKQDYERPIPGLIADCRVINNMNRITAISSATPTL